MHKYSYSIAAADNSKFLVKPLVTIGYGMNLWFYTVISAVVIL